jgi:cobalt-zinc-cadmium efflux system outer membrane protein
MKLRPSLPLIFAVVAMGTVSRAEPPPPSEPVVATSPPSGATERLTFKTYLQRVGQGNLDLAAQRATVSVAQAQIAVAKVFPDPQVTGGLGQYDLAQNGNNPTGTTLALNVPLQIGGQRGKRIAFAEANLSAAEADLEEFLRGLRADAANAYIDALHARLVLDRQRRSLTSLEQLIAANEQLLRVGQIGEVTLLQSRVEANQFRAHVLDAEGSVKVADLALVQLLGRGATSAMNGAISVDGDLLAATARTFDVVALTRRAEASRPDLIAARRRLSAASKQIELAQANRVIDIAVGAQWSHYFTLPGAQPPADLVGATLTVPLPFSRLYRGELDTAHATHKQAGFTADAIAVKVEVEVRTAIAKYDAAAQRVKLYTSGVLASADQVLDRTLYNFQRGGSTLVEVLVAQRTDNDVYLSYYDALADAAHALVAVQQASGSWDVDF